MSGKRIDKSNSLVDELKDCMSLMFSKVHLKTVDGAEAKDLRAQVAKWVKEYARGNPSHFDAVLVVVWSFTDFYKKIGKTYRRG